MNEHLHWVARINPQLHLSWLGRWPPGTVEPRRVLADHELVLFLKGTCRVTLGDTEFDCPAGTFVIVPPGVGHVTRGGTNEVERACFHFDWTHRIEALPPRLWTMGAETPLKPRARPRYVPPPPWHGRFDGASPVPLLARDLHRRWTAGAEVDRVTARALLLELLARLLSPTGPRTARDGEQYLALAVRDRLNAYDPRREGVRTLLRGMGYSYEHLCRVFGKQFGVSPLQYATAARMERAKTLLADRTQTVAQVAHGLGFEDAGYFTRVFRRYTGQTPGRFRTSNG